MSEILKDDVDNAHSSENVSAAVELEGLKETATVPKPFYLTSQFFTMLGTVIVGFIVAALTSMGMTVGDENFKGALLVVITGVIGAVAHKYLDGRNKVTAIKAANMARLTEIKASGEVEIARAAAAPRIEAVGGTISGEPMYAASPLGGFFNSLNMVKTGISIGLMMLGSPKKGTKKAKAVTALKAALAALTELENSGE